MPSVSAPFGLRPATHPSGTIRPTLMTIRSTYAADIFQNQPVQIVPSATGEGTIQAAAVGARFIGTFQGVEFTDVDGRRRVSNRWAANTVGTDINAYVTLDPAIIYEIQSDAALNLADIGKQYDFTAASGNAVTGLSSQMLAVSSSAANAGMRLIGLAPYPDNAWGDPFVVAQVMISEHQNVADVAAY